MYVYNNYNKYLGAVVVGLLVVVLVVETGGK
jgi:hypothetical protein